MKTDKNTRRGTWLKFAASALVLGGLVASAPLFTQANFDPSSVQPTDCANGKMKCGFVPLSSAQKSAIPEDPSNLVRHRGLPSRVDLSGKMPAPGSQGRQGSCVGWATAYAIKSYQENVERRWGFGRHPQQGGRGSKIFSPAFVYNQINGGRDRGSNPVNALRLMQRQGVSTWASMPYDQRNYTRRPPAAARNEAAKYKIKSFKYLNQSNPTAIKSVLAKGVIVLGGLKVYDNFYRLGRGVYTSGSGGFRGGHAIALIGYDDNKTAPNGDRGAFKIYNSWSQRWGQGGYGWVSYRGVARTGLGFMAVYDRKDSKPSPSPSGGGGTKPADVPDVPERPVVQKKELDPPARVTASKGTYSNKVYVSWSAVKGAVAYTVYRAGPGKPEFGKIGYAQSTTFSDNKVAADVAYRYAIVAEGSGGRSNIFNSPQAEGYAKRQPTNRVPVQVASLKAGQDSRGRVLLKWSDAGSASYYQVIRYNASARRWQYVSRRARSTSYTDYRPLRSSVNYYRVRAVNSAGYGKWSEMVQVSVGGRSQAPSRVTGLTVGQGERRDGIPLKWNRVASATTYYVVRYDPRVKKWTFIGRTSRTAALDRSAAARSGRVYAYTVMAANRAGRGKYAEPAAGFARAGSMRGVTLKAPKGVKAVINAAAKKITISWKASKGANDYYIFRKKAGDKEFKYVGATKGKLFYTGAIPGEAGTLWIYTVRAKSFFGESPNSKGVSGFINEERYVVRHRFLDDGFGRFKGTWKALVWDGESPPRELTLRVTRSGGNFKGVLEEPGKRARTFAGAFIAKSSSLDTKGFRMQLMGGNNGAGSVELVSGTNEVSLSFLRE